MLETRYFLSSVWHLTSLMSRSFPVTELYSLIFPSKDCHLRGKVVPGFPPGFWLRCFRREIFCLKKIFGYVTNSAKSFPPLGRRRGKSPPTLFFMRGGRFSGCLTVLCWISYPGEKFWLCRSSHWCSCQLLWSWVEAGLVGAERGSFLPQCSRVMFLRGIPPGSCIMPGLWAHTALALYCRIDILFPLYIFKEINLRNIPLKITFDLGVPSGLTA